MASNEDDLPKAGEFPEMHKVPPSLHDVSASISRDLCGPPLLRTQSCMTRDARNAVRHEGYVRGGHGRARRVRQPCPIRKTA